MAFHRFVLIALLTLISSVMLGQPFDQYLVLNGTNGYVEIPHSASLNPASEITIEAWVLINENPGCTSIVGKNSGNSYWVGVCGRTLTSYLRGPSSSLAGGQIPSGVWTHIAVKYDGDHREHYINGDGVTDRVETGFLPSNASALRIGSDVTTQSTPSGGIDEVRIWSVERRGDEIRTNMNREISTPQSGLIAVWHLNGNANDAVGSRHGALLGSATFSGASAGCNPSPTRLCIQGGRFGVEVTWQEPRGTSGSGRVVPGFSDSSGLFWFFTADNWELLVKVLDACIVNNRKWVFTAATTDVQYTVTVHDFVSGQTWSHTNPMNTRSAAITDTEAFATCP